MLSKRVALLTTEIPPYRHALFRALEERIRDFRVFVSSPAALHRPPPGWDVDVTFQHTLLLNHVWRHPTGFREPAPVAVPYDTLWQLQRYRPDVVISGEMGLRTVQALAYRRLRPGSRLVMWATASEENERGRGRWRESLRKWLVPRVDAVIVNGKNGAGYVRRCGAPAERVVPIPQTTHVRQFAEVSLERSPAQAKRLLYVGQLIDRKGLLPFLETLCTWASAHPRERVEFWLAGAGELRPRIDAQVGPPNLELRCLGQIGYNDLPATYAQAGIFAFPTLADEWALVVNEALAAGLPVLGSLYSQAVDELTVDGVTGWHFRPDHPEEMLAGLDRALSTPEEQLQQMRVAGRERLLRLTPEYVADRMVDVVRHVGA
jgi:glycosyltransferase involved in cell wall biosynthesis